MNRRDDRKPLPPDIEDDVEILEVVGLDEDDSRGPADARDPDSEGSGDDEAEYEIDVVFDEDAPPAPGGSPESTADEDTDARERYLRLQAEFENLKKRVEREKEDFYLHATASLVERLLPVLDNFDRAIAHATEDPATGGAFLDGVRLIHKQLLDELSRQGLRAIESVGEPFDPEHHEAVATEPRDDRDPGTVLMELQRGYFFRERLLRPALVQVSVDGGGTDGPGGGGDASSDGPSHGSGDGAAEA